MANPSIMVAMDLDNVAFDTIGAARSRLANMFGSAEHELVITGDYAVPLAWTSDTRTPVEFSHAFWDDNAMLATCQPIAGAVEAAVMLAERGMLVAYVTRRTPANVEVTRACLELHGFPPAGLHHIGDTDPARHHNLCKSEACRAVGATVLIDDSVGEAQRVMTAGITPVLVNHPVGRTSRDLFLQDNPGIFLAEDALHAAHYLLKQRIAA